MRAYILRILCGALLCGTVQSMTTGTGKGAVKLICGLFLTMTVLMPLADSCVDWEESLHLPSGEAWVQQGTDMAREALAQRIMAQTESYILDKAAPLAQNIQVEVTLGPGDFPVPVAAEIAGRVSPFGRSSLEGILEGELGIPKENIKWTG